MNLMFWKKKTGADEEAENARENPAANSKARETLDFVDAKRNIAGRAPEPSEMESFDTDESSPEAQAKPRFFARLKFRLSALARHFKKPPAFRAGGDHAPDAPGGAEEPDDATSLEHDVELEAPAKPRLAVWIKLQIVALARRFRKTPAPDADEGLADEADESGTPETPAKPGLFLRIKSAFAAFLRELKAPAAPGAGEDEGADSRGFSAAAENMLPAGEVSAEPAHSRKWLVIGGSILIVILLLIDIGITIWLTFEPPQKRWGTRHDITSVSSRPLRTESTPDGSQASAPVKTQAEIDALVKENAELQARVEALKFKKEPTQQRPYISTARQTGESAPPSSASGDMVVGSKEPKATAMSLKEAIEAMNAGAGDYEKKPAK